MHVQRLIESMNNANVDVIVFPTWSNPPRLIGDYYSPDGMPLCTTPALVCHPEHSLTGAEEPKAAHVHCKPQCTSSPEKAWTGQAGWTASFQEGAVSACVLHLILVPCLLQGTIRRR